MRCSQFCMIYLSIGVSCIFGVFSAPSPKMKQGKDTHTKATKLDSLRLKVLKQAENAILEKTDGDTWYPTLDLQKDSENYEYAEEQHTHTSSQAESSKNISHTLGTGGSKSHPGHAGAPTSSKSAKSSSKKKNKAAKNVGVKTICEDLKDAKCENKGSMGDTKAKSIVELIKTIEEITAKQNILTEKEIKQIREILVEMGFKVHQLEETAKKTCGNAGTTGVEHEGKEISEIEERHSTHRKLVKTQKHDENKHISEDEHVEAEAHIHGQKSESESSQSVASVAQQQSQQNTNTENYLDGERPDVNYNGGINQPMQLLKEIWPDGHWPGDGDEYHDDGEEEEYYDEETDKEELKENGQDENSTVSEMNVMSLENEVGKNVEQK